MSKTIAIAGINGLLGHPILNGLLEPAFKASFSLPIRVITRKVDAISTADVEYYEANDLSSYEKALKGVDVLIDVRSFAALGNHDIIIAAKNSGVKAYIPSEFGSNYHKAGKYELIFQSKAASSEFAKQQGLKVIQFHTSYFIDTTLSSMSAIIFVNPEKAEADYVGDGSVTVSLTSLKNIGQSVAAALTHPLEELPDSITIAGDHTTPSKVAELYEKYSGKKITVTPSTLEQVTKAADEAIATGQVFKDLASFFLVLRLLSLISDASNFKSHNDNEFINPGEKYFKWESVENYAAKLFA